MEEHVYRHTEVIGSSSESMEQAVQNAVSRASKTLHNLRWFEVVETRGRIDDESGEVADWQVTIKIGFTLDDEG